MKKLIFIIGIIVLAVGVAAMAMHDSSSDMRMHDNNHTHAEQVSGPVRTDKVTISNYAFSPATVVIKKGTTVTWNNQDKAHHNVVIDSGPLKGSEGKLMAQGESYSLTFPEAGTYTYHCAPHPYMKATITVEE